MTVAIFDDDIVAILLVLVVFVDLVRIVVGRVECCVVVCLTLLFVGGRS